MERVTASHQVIVGDGEWLQDMGWWLLEIFLLRGGVMDPTSGNHFRRVTTDFVFLESWHDHGNNDSTDKTDSADNNEKQW